MTDKNSPPAAQSATKSLYTLQAEFADTIKTHLAADSEIGMTQIQECFRWVMQQIRQDAILTKCSTR